MKKLDVNNYSSGHLTYLLSLHYLVKCRSRSLAIYNNACATQYEIIVVNDQTVTSAFHKVASQQYKYKVAKTTFIYAKFLHDVDCQKISKSANVSQRYSKKN